MLKQYPPQGDATDKQASNAFWLDLLDPTPNEVAAVEKQIGASLPSLGALSEIETSSRLRRNGDTLFLSTPSAARRPEEAQATPPLGFVLSKDRLVTVRFMQLQTFDAVEKAFSSGEEAPQSSFEVFILICEEIVDRVADILEHLAKDLNLLSVDVFRSEDPKGHHAAHANRILREQLGKTGRLGDRLSEIRDGLRGLARITTYTAQQTEHWSESALKPRMASICQDIHSLIEYEEQLSNKVQFVLDALVGLIGIAQNDLFKVLTIVSIIGIPPTLMAGVYGMNFKYMPEYDWSWGYPYAWGVIILSALLPLVWFKAKRWF